MKYYKTTLRISPFCEDFADAISSMLCDIGYETFVSTETGLEAYIPEPLMDTQLLEQTLAGCPLPGVSVTQTTEEAEHDDWNKTWEEESFRPIVIGKTIAVHSPEHTDIPEVEYEILISPHQTFGTGSHHTTRMCLEFLEKTVKAGDDMIDMGCGSGILSIASLLLGAKEAVAVDIDPIAEKIAYENAAMNGIGKDTYTVLVGDVLSDSALQDKLCEKKYDVVAANIVASVIIELSAIVPKLIKKDGVFIMSGIIAERLDEVLCALDKNGFEVLEVKAGDDWRAILARPKR